jgi:hypothetical protein
MRLEAVDFFGYLMAMITLGLVMNKGRILTANFLRLFLILLGRKGTFELGVILAGFLFDKIIQLQGMRRKVIRNEGKFALDHYY